LRAYLYLDELQSAELTQARNDSFDGRVIEDYLQKALDEIDRAGRLCPEGDGRCRGEYLRGKANAFNLVVNYYLRRNDTAKAAEYERLRNKAHTHAETLEKQERSEFGKEEDNLIIQLHNTEYGKIGYELERGWKDKVIRGVTGLSVPEILAIEKNDKEKSEKIWKQTLSEIKGKIANGSASAEEYLVLSQMEDNTQERKAYFDQGIALFEKRNPQGIEALLLVNIYWDRTIMESEDVRLLYLNKAQKIIDKNLPAAQRAVGVDEFKALFHELEKESKAPQNIVPKLARYDRKQAEALHWFQMAMTVSQLKAEIYERLDLPRKAREAYLYLCETLKSDEACRNAERLKK
ncbi:MAG: hypothetical protein N2Z74_01665, partial [Syntrophales bacterium]|nr:hypothetical protein [Syntrophales bacterium]